MEISIKVEFGVIKIFFDDVLHLRFNKDKLLGFQSWVYDEKFIIEYYLVGGSIETEYNNKEKWKKILKLLDENL